MQYKVKILPSILFSSSGCSRQQTHSLCVRRISHRSQVHQNLCFLTDKLLLPFRSLSSGLGTRSGSKKVNLKISHEPRGCLQNEVLRPKNQKRRLAFLQAYQSKLVSDIKWRLFKTWPQEPGVYLKSGFNRGPAFIN